MAVMPGVALQTLWDLVGVAERALLLVSALVVIAGLVGMATVLLASLEHRRREMAILRSVGARPVHLVLLLVAEAAFIALVGGLLGMALVYGVLAVVAPLVTAEYGIVVSSTAPGAFEAWLLAGVVAGGAVLGLLPALRAYRHSLHDGLSVRV